MAGLKLWQILLAALIVLLHFATSVQLRDDWEEDVCKSRLFQQDIALTTSDLMKTRRTRRAATAFKNRRWKDGVIPYEIDTTFTGEQKALIRQAMRHWENHTCLTFIERSSDKDHIFFHKGDCGCCSYVGRKGTGRQGISIGKNCDKFGIIVHELGHVVGFWHEHTRPDRDGNVKIIKENIKPGEEHNFVKLTTNEVNSLNEPYDYGSIMHYARNTFSKDGYQSTIIPRKNPGTNYRPDIGQRLRLSKGDISQANKMYKCPRCGRTFQEKSGDFSSPGFPERYPINQDCIWRLSVTPGEKIVLNFTSFEIEYSDNCDYDHVEIRDGHSKNSPLIGRFCGKVKPQLIWSSESRLWINFKSDATVFAPGFKAHYEAVCGGLIEKERGEIQSPNYPSYYEADKKCIWTITVPKGKQVGLKFLSFDVESGYGCLYDHVEIFDGGDTKATSLGKFCGRNKPNDIKSSSGQITIKFVSDSSINKPGFALSFFSEIDECQKSNGGCEQLCVNTLGGYHCECKPGFEIHSNGKNCESACGGELTLNSGNISSPSYPDHYPKKKHCIWQIVVPKGSQISLKFHDFELEGSEVCRYDYVNITSGMEKKHVGKFCGSTVPDVITSDSNVMWIEFKSDHSVSRRGFSASYYADMDECKINNGNCHSKCINTVGSYRCACGFGYKLHSDQHSCKEAGNCNVVLTAPSEELMSPNFPGIYPSNKECLWRISVTQGHRIQLTFEKFELEEAAVQNCSYDFVEVFSGYGRNPDLLGRFCGNKHPPSLISTTHRMMVKFKSDDHVGRSGFRATYSTVCGVNLHAIDHVKSFFSHPAYGDDNYGRNMRCTWQIKAKPGYVIKLSFTEFDVEKESICGYDYVKIHDGVDMTSPLLGQVCGNNPTNEFTSSTNFMWIEFFTDETTNRKGFIAEYKRVRIRKDKNGDEKPKTIG